MKLRFIVLESDIRCSYQKHGKRIMSIKSYSLLILRTYCLQFNMLVKYFGDVDTEEVALEHMSI